MLIVVEGIDGSGKSVVLDAARSFFESKGMRVLDLRGKETYPEVRLLLHYDVLLCEEPTHCARGKLVRKQLRDPDPAVVAQAFSDDREELFEKAIRPMLERGKIVLEERSFLSSWVYQGMQALSWSELARFPGNTLAKGNPPALVILADVSVPVALERLAVREKKDHAVFEKAGYLQRARDRYHSEDFARFVSKLGAALEILDTSGSIEETKARAMLILEKRLSPRRTPGRRP